MKPIKTGLKVLSNPQKEFDSLNKRTLESVVGDYITLLVAVAIAAGLASFLYTLIKAIYLDMSLSINIQYLRMMNYSLGRSISLLFFYLFAGTFLLFFLSWIIRLFLRKVKYSSLLKILFYSLTPMLLFAWLLPNPLPLGIWSIFLFAIGIKAYRHEKIRKDSIKKRE